MQMSKTFGCKPILTMFLDGLKYESLKYMPFLNSFLYKHRMKTILGYSVGCHASMYSGVYPNKHLLWFIWKYSPHTSPFRWLRGFEKVGILDNLAGKYFCHKIAGSFEKNTACFGIPLVINLPLKYWPHIDVAEKKLWNEPGYLEKYPTLFDILRANKIEFEIVGMAQSVNNSVPIVEQHTFSEIKPWTYLFMGDVDSFSHKLMQDSPEAIHKLRYIDRVMETRYREFEKKVGEFHSIVVSDHGHIPIKNRIDLYRVFKKDGYDLNSYMHIVDANYARFWFRNDREKEIVKQVLLELPCGFILSEELQKKYCVNMPDNRYGDLVFYLDAPNIFSKTIWGYGRTQKSMHGYLPDHRDSDGIFISNTETKDIDYVNLVDILPSTLALLEIPIPDYIDGQVLWK